MKPWIALPVVLLGCGDDDGGQVAGDAPASVDAPGPGVDAAAGGWESVETTFDDGAVIVERVSYRSGGLLVWGQVCRPAGAGPFPVIVFNHGGFQGLIGEWNGGFCLDAAQMGFAQIESSYRGEDGSEGSIEVCLGEVDDVLAMIDVALVQPWADPDRVAMWGGSHGGCITTRAVQRGAPVHAAVDVFGPGDMAAEYAFFQEGIAAGAPESDFYRQLIALLEEATGGTPDEQPAAYTARSPTAFAGDLAASPIPFMVVQGVDDPLVPPEQSCGLVAAAGGFEAYHLDSGQNEVTMPPTGCESSGLTWSAGPRPTTWPGDRYLLVYDGAGHSFDGPGGMAMVQDAASFLLAKLPP